MRESGRSRRGVWIVHLAAALIIISGWLFAPLAQVVLVIFAGAMLGVFLCHMAKLVAGFASLSYQAAFAIVIAAVLLIGCGSFYYMGSQTVDQVREFAQQFEQARSDFESRFNLQEWSNWLPALNQKQSAAATTQAISTAKRAATSAIAVLGGMILLLFLGFYFALQPDKYRNGFLVLFPQHDQKHVAEVLDRITHRLWRWTLGRLVGMAVIGVGSAVGLWALGVPLPITLGVLAGLLNFVPNVGPLIAAIPATLFALQQSTNTAIYVVAFYVVLQFLESYFLTPLIDQHQVSLPPGLTLAWQLLMGVIAGFLGLLMATPLAVVAFILIRDLQVTDANDSH